MGRRSTVQTVALVFGAVYTAAGVLGFLPFVVSNNRLLGLFPINALHNLVHVVIGIGGLAAASSLDNAKRFCRVVGVILLLLGVMGIIDHNPLGLIELGGLDIALHMVSGVVLAYFGFAAPVLARSP
jgi:Domain of unknown function (DUF4383)